IFPQWMAILGIEAQIVGIDLPLHAPAEQYRAVVEDIKHDLLVCGALVTTHKIDLFRAAHDLFDTLDPYARLCQEVSCFVKKAGRFEGYAKDPVSAVIAWQSFVPAGHFERTQAEVLCLGSGGAAVATTAFLANVADRPRRFTLVDISPERLDYARRV